MQKHPYFEGKEILILAHRGGLTPTENTCEAFTVALAAGADIIETDIQATRDRIAVLFHDETLERLAGVPAKVSELTLEELRDITLSGGGEITSLAQALEQFPNTKFNIDVKDQAAIDDLVKVVDRLSAHDRVLVSSFSNRRRLAALSRFSKPVATSASASVVIKVWLLSLLWFPDSAVNRALRDIGALQIPRKMKFIKLDSPRFVRQVIASGTQLHYWTINDPDEIIQLASLGASGIVTDVPELAVQTLRKV